MEQGQFYSKIETEQQRYRKDCRKKAFEAAWNEKNTLLQQANSKADSFNVQKLADAYYNWLLYEE